jgi:hypothetical protein
MLRGFLAVLLLVSVFLLFLCGVSVPAKADHCPDWAAACTHPFAGGVTAAASAPGRRARGRDRAARPRAGVSTAGMPPQLIAAIADVQRQCPGFRVTSGFRRGARVRGSGRPSLHASNKAVDIAGGSFTCAYAVLAGFGGGMTTDAHRVRPPHIHLSWAPGSGEFGRRFAHFHGRPGRHARRVRLARR